MEREAARARPDPGGEAAAPGGEPARMLVRRGLRPEPTHRDLPFPPGLPEPALDRLAERLGHYGFRLFLRGALQRASSFAPAETTRYLEAARARQHAEFLVRAGLAERLGRGRYRLSHPSRNFGGTLEWYVAREIARRYGMETAAGLKTGARGIGGDLDVVATAEGKLVYLELKSSPPKHLAEEEMAAFVERVSLLRPDVTVLAVDTALRLADKVVPMLEAALRAAGAPARAPARRLVHEIWAFSPSLYALNAKPDLIANIGRALAAGLRALGPEP
jgi:hypothetical protein